MTRPFAQSILAGTAEGRVLFSPEGLSFWGGVDPATGLVIDVHHPLLGACLTGAVLAMPSSRGSCTGSGVLLDLVLSGKGPAALIFREPEDVLTLGALVASAMFGKTLPVLRLGTEAFDRMAKATQASVTQSAITLDGTAFPVAPPATEALDLTPRDHALLAGDGGAAAALAMRIICAMAANQGATGLLDVSQAHIDGCIYASPANLTFADRMADLGGQVIIPTTMNAISVDYHDWQAQGTPPRFGGPAKRLAEAYVRMGCKPSFTCAPYLLETAPSAGEAVAWAESNAVVFANSVLGARTAKHPDFLDLCIALTGRAPLAGVYLDAPRRPAFVIDIDLPAGIDDAFWPLIGYMAGTASPDHIPLLRGLAAARPSRDDLKALCAAFGTTSAAAMLHLDGLTPEAGLPLLPGAGNRHLTRADMRAAWDALDRGPPGVDLVAIGSPHASAEECVRLCDLLAGRPCHPKVAVIVTCGAGVMAGLQANGTLGRLQASGVQVLRDLCWCSISEPVFPPGTHAVMTNSGKYAHYGPGLCGRPVRFGSLADCAEAAVTGLAPAQPPRWLG